MYDAKTKSAATGSYLISENEKDAIEASEAAVVATTGGAAATGAEATGLSRTATEGLGAAGIDLLLRLVEVPTAATVTDTSRKTDVADAVVVRPPDPCLPTPETQPHGPDHVLAPSLAAGVVADAQVPDQSHRHAAANNPVDHRLAAAIRVSGRGLESEMIRLAEAVVGRIHPRPAALPSPAAADIRQHLSDADTPVREAGHDLPIEAVADGHAGLGLHHTLVRAVAALVASPSGSSSAAVALLAD